MSKPRVFTLSLYPTYVVNIKGQQYSVKAIDRDLMGKLDELRAKYEQEQARDLLYEIVALVIEAPKDLIDKLHLGEVVQLVSFIADLVKGILEPGQKNGSKPGETTLQP